MTTGSMSPIRARRWEQYPDEPIVEWTLDRNIHMTYRTSYGMSWATFEVEDGIIDLTRMQDDFVEGNLLEPLKRAGFEVKYETDPEPTPGLLRRLVTFILP